MFRLWYNRSSTSKQQHERCAQSDPPLHTQHPLDVQPTTSTWSTTKVHNDLVDHRSLDHNRIIEATPATDVSTLLQHTMRHHAAHNWSVHNIDTRSGCPIVSCETERVFS